MKVILAIVLTGSLALSGSWFPVTVDAEQEPLAFGSEDWSYPWYIYKFKSEFFKVAKMSSGSITPADTVHIPHNARCAIGWYTGTDKYGFSASNALSLEFARANVYKDSLYIVIYGSGNSLLEEVRITVAGAQCKIQYDTYSRDRNGNSEIDSHRLFHVGSLSLNTQNPSPSDLLTGTFNFEGKLNAYKKSKLEITGRFAAVVEQGQ